MINVIYLNSNIHRRKITFEHRGVNSAGADEVYAPCIYWLLQLRARE